MELTGGAFSCGRIVLSPRPVAPNPLGGERDIALGAAKNPGTVSFAEPSSAVGLMADESAAGREVLPLIIVRYASLLERPGIPCIGRLPLVRAFLASDVCRLAPPLAGLFLVQRKLAYSADVHQGIDKARRNRVFAAPGDVSIPPGVTCRWAG